MRVLPLRKQFSELFLGKSGWRVPKSVRIWVAKRLVCKAKPQQTVKSLPLRQNAIRYINTIRILTLVRIFIVFLGIKNQQAKHLFDYKLPTVAINRSYAIFHTFCSDILSVFSNFTLLNYCISYKLGVSFFKKYAYIVPIRSRKNIWVKIIGVKGIYIVFNIT